MLCEKLIQAGATLKQINTDGVLYLIDKQVDIDSVLKTWEEETKLSLETDEFEAFYQYAINDYLGVGKGFKDAGDISLLKYKGLFIEKTSLGKGMTPPIIAKAINKYFIDSTPPEQTIRASRDIHDFLTYTKVDKKFSIEYNGKLITRINRYYASTNGYSLYKCKVGTVPQYTDIVRIHYSDGNIEDIESSKNDYCEIRGKYYLNGELQSNIVWIEKRGKQQTLVQERTEYEHLLKASGVTILNDLREMKEFPTNINYLYYIDECYKIIYPIITEELSLF